MGTEKHVSRDLLLKNEKQETKQEINTTQNKHEMLLQVLQEMNETIQTEQRLTGIDWKQRPNMKTEKLITESRTNMNKN